MDFTFRPGEVFDYDLDLLVDVARVLDRHIDAGLGAGDLEFAEQRGVFDVVEHATGVGFTAAQVFMTATIARSRLEKPKALLIGPSHSSGLTIATIVNAAANFWKHSAEWPPGEARSARARTEAVLDAVGFPNGTEYPLCGILTELVSPGPPSISSVVSLLRVWREDLLRA